MFHMFRVIVFMLGILLILFGFFALLAQAGPPLLMSEEKGDLLRSQIPYVDDEDIQRLLDDPTLVLYTNVEMPPAYQDWKNLPGIHSPKYNVASSNRELHGNGNMEFPWKSPGGTHRTFNVSTFRFLWLPVDKSDKKRPVVWYRKMLSGSSTKGYAWTYPVGTVVGEVLRMKSPYGKIVTFELRVRIREYGEWAVDVFRPFPTSEDLAYRIKQLRPQWEYDPKIAKLVRHLERPASLPIRTLRDSRSHSQVVFKRTMGIDTLPNIGDDQLVVELLTQTVFRSVLGEDWRRGTNGATTAAPTTLVGFHVIPAKYDAGFIEVDRFSCMDCHNTVNQHVDDFQRRDWYGRIRGSDGIFSFHPFALNSISYNGSKRVVRMNGKLVSAGLLEKFDPSIHSSKVYQLLYTTRP